jgi:hypothetical protein
VTGPRAGHPNVHHAFLQQVGQSPAFLDGDFDQLDGAGDGAPIVISEVECTPKAILIIRDPFRGKMRFRFHPFERGKS